MPQCIKIIKTYYKNGDSATAIYRALRGDYSLHNRLTTQANGKIVKKFEETETFTGQTSKQNTKKYFFGDFLSADFLQKL